MSECRVCNLEIGEPFFRTEGGKSITSLCNILQGDIEVSFCHSCGHLQTNPLPDLERFYGEEYKILIDSDDEDQLLFPTDGQPVFRSEFQSRTLINKTLLPTGARILDYGCAKAGSLKSLIQIRPDLQPYCFDISEMYVPFWKKFLPDGHWAVRDLPANWLSSFDVVTSFFALEHVESPHCFLDKIKSLLKPGGIFYGIVPNVFSNPADFLVADHINHFSFASLSTLFSQAGWDLFYLDADTHSGAWIFQARVSSSCGLGLPQIHSDIKDELWVQAEGFSKYWRLYIKQLNEFEVMCAHNRYSAIYGSGFYGTLIAANLQNRDNLICFLDRNPHRQKQRLMGVSIMAPEHLPDEVEILYMGLNPNVSSDVVQILKKNLVPKLLLFCPDVDL